MSVIEWIYNFKPKLFPVDAIGFNAGFKVYQGVCNLLPICHIYSKYNCIIYLNIYVVLNRQLRKEFRHASSWSTNFSLLCVVLIRVCLNEDETFKSYVRYYHHLMSIPLCGSQAFTETTGPIVFKRGKSVHQFNLNVFYSEKYWKGLDSRTSLYISSPHCLLLVCVWKKMEFFISETNREKKSLIYDGYTFRVDRVLLL